MAGKSIKATDRRTQSTANNVLEQVSTGSKEQTILITDIISEGEIEGLVHGDSSVYLNNDPIISLGASPYRSSGPLSISLNATTTATVSTGADGIFKAIKGTDPKFLIVHDLYSGTVTLSGHSVVGGTSNFRVGRAQQYTLTSADPLFNSDMEHSGSDFNPNLSAEHLAEGDALVSITTSSGRTLTGIITGVNSTTEATFIYRGRPVTDNLVDASITISIFLEIASISGNIVTLENNAPVTTSNKAFSITAPINSEEAEKYRSGFVEFAPGTLNQEPLMTLAGSGTTSSVLNVTGAPNLEAINSEQTIDTSNISGAAAQEVDKVKLIFSYPSGIYIVSGESGREDSTAAAYLITLNITRKTTGGTTTEVIELQGDRILTASEVAKYNGPVTETLTTSTGVFTHSGKFKTGVTFEETIDLEPYKPFNDFSINVRKVVFGNSDNTENANRMPKSAANLMPVDNRFTGTNTATIKTALGIINERLNLPYTAHANVRFNSKDFSSVPTRTYDCYGLKIAVPSGYRTREQTGGDPVYPAFWDGSFSTTKVYTDNPAWVFYDIVTHDRYGLGEWLSTVDISIYDLYKISRYCDELVPDGQGGFEPRFRANIYLTKAADAYKVLKDMATIFRGILYWSNAELMPISDMPQSPIYTFSTSNVIDGKFHYESTGNNTRVNQVIVTWNNPDSDYKLEPLIVEDRDNIVKTGKIVKDDAVAFGCTSQGQALRYGKWKLWTSVNQTEIVSFQSSLNAGFLSVGDVINIQDSHDYTVMYSGRLRGYDSVDDEKLLLDRTPYDLFNAITDNFSISVIIPKKSFTIDESATILDTRTYSTTVSGLSPLAWFALDDNSGTEITDTSGNTNHGTIVTGTHTEIGNAYRVLDIPNGTSFDYGYDDDHYFELDRASTSTLADAFTISAWIETPASYTDTNRTGDFAYIFGDLHLGTNSTSPGFGGAGLILGVKTDGVNDGKLFAEIRENANVVSETATTALTLNTSTKYHFAATWDSNGDRKVRLYVDGTLVYTTAALAGTGDIQSSVAGTWDWTFGGCDYSDGGDDRIHWAGKLDNIALWDSVLTPTNISDIHEDGAATYTPFNAGDLITGVSGSFATDSDDSVNRAREAHAVDSVGNFISVTFSSFSKVQTQPGPMSVSTAYSGLDVNRFRSTVKSASWDPWDFDSEEEAKEAIWYITEITDEGALVGGSPKEYKILSITEEAKNLYGIVAVEYYDNKFDSVDNEFILDVPDVVKPAEDRNDVPPPGELLIVRQSEANKPGEEFKIQWAVPSAILDSSPEDIYEYLAGFEVTHNIGGTERVDAVSRGSNSIEFEGVPNGTYNVCVRTVSEQGRYSVPKCATFDVEDTFGGNAPRIKGIPWGALTTSAIGIRTTPTAQTRNETLYFERDTYGIVSDNNPGQAFIFSNVDDISQIELDCTPMWDTGVAGAWAYMDISTLGEAATQDSLKLIAYRDNDPVWGINYWYDLTKWNSDPSTIWNQVTGTIDYTNGSTKVTGTGTSFLTDFKAYNNIKIESLGATVSSGSLVVGKTYRIETLGTTNFDTEHSNSLINNTVGSYFVAEVIGTGTGTVKEATTYAAVVSFVKSDTELYIDRTWDVGATAFPCFNEELGIDYENDFIFSAIYNPDFATPGVGDQAFTILPLLTVDPASYFVDQRTVYFGKGVPTSVLYEDKHDIFYDIDSGTPSPNTWNRYTFDGAAWNLQSSDGVANAVANVYDDPSSTVIDVHTTGLVTDVIYVIETSGTSVNWTSIGASSDTVGTIFQKNAVAISGSGGTARRATKRLFWGPDEPDATNIDNDANPVLSTSDMWYNTETDTVSYRYDDTIPAWVPYTAANSADSNKNYTYKSSTEPTDAEALALGFTGLKDGDTWIDDANGKKQYRYDFDTTTWVRETPALADLNFVEGNDTNRSSISIGAGALGSYTDQAMGNTTIGFESAAVLVGTTGNDAGDFNTSIGYQSLKNLTLGNFNTAVGAQAGINLIGTVPGVSAPAAEGVQNCVFGYAAGNSFREASFNISIGSISGTRILSATWADETSHHNIYIGRQAGADSFGDHNIFVGDSVGYIFGSDVTGSNNIIIGRNTNINAFGATDDNKFIINGRVNEQYPLILGDMSASPNRDFTINAPLTVSNAHGNSNGSLTVEGISTFAGNITAQSNATVEGFLTQKVGTDVLSAAALDLDASGNAGNYFDVTGTTTITSINTVAVGTIVYLHFDGACTLTHHATNLILPSGDDITTAAGDEFTFVEYGTGTWRCIGYTLASGEAIVGGAGGGGGGATAVNGTAQVKVLIDEITDPGSGGYVFDSLGSGYEQIIIEGQVKSTRASQDWDGLAMFFNDDETVSNYHKQSVGAQDGGNTIVIEGDDANVVVIPAANSNSDLTGDFEIVIEQPFGTTFRKTARSYYGGHRDAGYSRLEGRVLSHDTLTSAITKIKLISGEGGTVSGTIRMYGVKQATVYSNLNLTSVKSAAYTAEPFDLIPVNTNSGSVTITLPASPVNGQSVGIFDYHQHFGTNSCTLNRNGSNIEGAALNFVANTNNQALRFTWIDSGQGWCRTP